MNKLQKGSVSVFRHSDLSVRDPTLHSERLWKGQTTHTRRYCRPFTSRPLNKTWTQCSPQFYTSTRYVNQSAFIPFGRPIKMRFNSISTQSATDEKSHGTDDKKQKPKGLPYWMISRPLLLRSLRFFLELSFSNF